ncbi:MAG: hypothetical protein NTX33_01895 [Propionibacteriales bacterium]|nr:hypothetical protein [Propionibacteriales bacterium]
MTTTTAPLATATSTTTGRFWFAADSVVSGVNGLAYLALAGPIADLLGADAATYRWLGLFMLGYATVVGLYARSSMSARAGWAIVLGNAVWVIASLEVAATGMFGLDGPGRAWAVAQALVVADLALMQARALRAR